MTVVKKNNVCAKLGWLTQFSIELKCSKYHLLQPLLLITEFTTFFPNKMQILIHTL